MLFNLVMDSLLSEISSRSLGISINGPFLGAFAHADDLQTMVSNIEDTTKQATFVTSFTRSRGLHLCPEKCALLLPGNNSPTSSLKIDDETSLQFEKSVKCLGVWWDNSTSSHVCIKEWIQKARATFFSNGQLGAFHGLNLLSSRSIVESYILPVLLYGFENWVLNRSLIEALESFQAELGRRVLKLPKFSSNTVPLLVLNWPTMCATVLCNKLSFLLRMCNGESTSLNTQVFSRSIAVSDVTSMSIVKQCHFLDSILETQFTNEVLNNPELSLRDLKKRILEADHLKIVEKSENHPSLSHILHYSKGKPMAKILGCGL